MPFLTVITIQATLVLLAAFAMSFLLRRSSASARHLLWTLALAAVTALPLLSLLAPRVPAMASPVRRVMQEITVTAQDAPAQINPQRPGTLIVLYVWMAGALLIFLRLAAGLLRVAVISRRATTIEKGGFETRPYVRRAVTVKKSDRTAIPVTWGVLRPVILLPESADCWSPDRMRIVLAHELAHVKRQDCLTQILAQIACALYWFHPLVWVAVARLRREREQACDDRVLALGNSASDYAAHLVEVARSLRFSERWVPAVAMAEPRELEARVIALLDPHRRRGTVTRGRAVLCGMATVVLILPLATLRAPAQARAAIAGSVYDATGAAIPHATVTLSNLDTGSRDALSTSDEGSYAFVGIPAGRYALEVGKPGFKLFTRRDITVAANVPARLDPTLEVGSVNESVDVIGQNGRPAPAAPTAIPTRIRIGGNVQATKLISQVKPDYPEILQQQGIEGTILLQAIIAKDGGLSALTVMNALANPDLAKAAVDAVKQWRYEPTLLNGNPVEVATTIKVNFKLK